MREDLLLRACRVLSDGETAVALVVLASREHALAKRRRLNLRDLRQERWAVSPPELPLGKMVAATFASSGVLATPAAAVVALSIHMRLNLVRTGRFLTTVTRSTASQALVRDWVKALPVVDIAPPPGRVCLLRLARRKSVAASATVSADPGRQSGTAV